jgi:hypothetical protein
VKSQQVYAMLENQSLWQVATQCHQLLAAAEIPHALVGGVAVCLHGYQRNTVDLDLLIRKDDSQAVREILERESFAVFWSAALFRRFFPLVFSEKNKQKQSGGKAPHSKKRQSRARVSRDIPREAEFRAPSGVAVQFLVAGERAGPGSEVALPDPGDERATTEIEGLPVLTLAKLIESKTACGQGNLRRTHKDFADVVELIVQNRLNSSFARFLHKSLRTAFRQLVRTSRGKP